jgi:HEPN domain-containing protein
MEDVSRRAIEDAREWFDSARLNLGAGNFSKSVYALEMAVEIAMKAILIASARDYPKRHDVYDLLEEAVMSNPGKFSLKFKSSLPAIKSCFRALLNFRTASGYGFDTHAKTDDFREVADRYYSRVEEILNLCQSETDKLAKDKTF